MVLIKLNKLYESDRKIGKAQSTIENMFSGDSGTAWKEKIKTTFYVASFIFSTFTQQSHTHNVTKLYTTNQLMMLTKPNQTEPNRTVPDENETATAAPSEKMWRKEWQS